MFWMKSHLRLELWEERVHQGSVAEVVHADMLLKAVPCVAQRIGAASAACSKRLPLRAEECSWPAYGGMGRQANTIAAQASIPKMPSWPLSKSER